VWCCNQTQGDTEGRHEEDVGHDWCECWKRVSRECRWEGPCWNVDGRFWRQVGHYRKCRRHVWRYHPHEWWGQEGLLGTWTQRYYSPRTIFEVNFSRIEMVVREKYSSWVWWSFPKGPVRRTSPSKVGNHVFQNLVESSLEVNSRGRISIWIRTDSLHRTPLESLVSRPGFGGREYKQRYVWPVNGTGVPYVPVSVSLCLCVCLCVSVCLWVSGVWSGSLGSSETLALCVSGSLGAWVLGLGVSPWVSVGSLSSPGPWVSGVWVSRSSKYGTNQYEVRIEPVNCRKNKYPKYVIL
jgi:hypothetical protein